jgi:hypothetical protein
MRRNFIIGLVALGLTATAVHAPGYDRIRVSVRNFQRYCQDLKAASSLSPIERLVFSLVWANARAQADGPAPAIAPSRT